MPYSIFTFCYKSFCSLPNIRGVFKLASLLDGLGPFPVETQKGICIKAYLSSTNDRAFMKKSHENASLFAAIMELNANSIFIDIGANVG